MSINRAHEVHEPDQQQVYDAIKARVIANDFRPGQRMMAEVIAEDLDVSKTPVLEALPRLFAERLIDMTDHAEFTAKRASETEIRELYELNQQLLEYALGRANGTGMSPDKFPKLIQIETPSPSAPEPEAREIVEITGELFAHIASLSGSGEIVRNIQNINDRLHHTRLSECEILETPIDHVLELCELYYQDSCRNLVRALRAYHAKRIYCLPDLMMAIRQ